MVHTILPSLVLLHSDSQQQQKEGMRERLSTVLLQEWHLPATAEVSTQPRRIAWKERKQEGKWKGTDIY